METQPPNLPTGYTVTALVIQGLFVSLAGYWIQSPQNVGTAIAALGIAGVVMAVRADRFTRTEKIVWVLVASLLFYAETRSIKRDRKETDEQQANLRQDQADNFTAVLMQNQRAFNATMKRMERLSDLSKENVDAVTGGDGFVYMDIVTAPVDKDGLSLMATVHGKNVIRGVIYQMNEGKPPYRPSEPELNELLAGRSLNITIGDLTPATSRLIGRVLHPSAKDGGYYNFNIFALNGSINEKMEVRYEATGSRWNRRITVTKNNKTIFSSGWY